MKRFFLIVAVLISGFHGYSQRTDPEPEPVKEGGFDRSRLFAGGNFGVSFGNFTLVNLSPQLGYRFNRYLAAGAGINFLYSSQKTVFQDRTNRVNQGVAGLNIFGRFYPVEQIFLQVQPEINYTWGKIKESGMNFSNTYKLESRFIPSLLLGAGGAIPTGGRGAFIIMAQYDVLQDSRTPYGDKIFFNFGYNVGF